MSCDKLVFDLSQEIEGSPNIFIKKDWLNILDNQNGNYGANQSVVDTSQLSNSNKYLSYREAYFLMPLLLTVTSGTGSTVDTTAGGFKPATAGTSADYAFGLKNWFGSMIHSFTLDYNGTTIIQQTPYCNMWNAFKLMTSLSWGDVATIGPTIGFYPDDPLSWAFNNAASPSGVGVVNNTNLSSQPLGVVVDGAFNNYKSANGNNGFLQRQTYINYDKDGDSGTGTYGTDILDAPQALWKSYILKKVDGVNYAVGPPVVPSVSGVLQIAITATVYLRHIHSFFQMVPLLKGVYMKMTMNLNNTTTQFTSAGGNLDLVSVSNAVGGVNPLMIASSAGTNGGKAIGADALYYATINVGSRCLNNQQANIAGVEVGPITNLFLYLPAYTFNPIFEQSYLSSPVKKVQYTDIYQYQILNTVSGGNINALATNGIANIKSVLCLPYYSAGTVGASGLPNSLPVYQSPFDPAGCGPTSPLCLLTNFNVVVSGQNTIYNTELRSFEQFNNQLLGVNAVNGSLVDGLTSGLVSALGFEMEYCYYYVDVSRMLPVEESVPKSVQIVAQNKSKRAIDLFVFIEYGVEVSIDVLTGARV